MPSDFMEILTDLQKDLGALTIGAVGSNHALSTMITLYSGDKYTPEKNKQCVADWSKAVTVLGNALASFVDNVQRLEAYANGQR